MKHFVSEGLMSKMTYYLCVFCFVIRLSGVRQNCASILSRNISSLLTMMVSLSKFLFWHPKYLSK